MLLNISQYIGWLPQNRAIQPKMSVVPGLRKPAVHNGFDVDVDNLLNKLRFILVR